MIGTVQPRAPYQGLLQIFAYNRPFYIRTISGAIVAIMLSVWLPLALRTLLLLAAGTAVFWTCSSLLVSHYVYDRSGFYTLRWLHGCLSQSPTSWINIHSGIDETSPAIASMFPDSRGQVVDIYDPRDMSEPSIERARSIATVSSTSADYRALPAPSQEFDVAFLIFTAHELRRQENRVILLREITRLLRIGGELVLVEHVRDWANFFAFGPGFLHFYPERIWQNAAKAAGLPMRLHRKVTPFVHVLVFQRLQ